MGIRSSLLYRGDKGTKAMVDAGPLVITYNRGSIRLYRVRPRNGGGVATRTFLTNRELSINSMVNWGFPSTVYERGNI